MKTVSQIEQTIMRRLRDSWHEDLGGSARHWPYTFRQLGQPSSADLETDFAAWAGRTVAINDWAARFGLGVECRNRRVHGTLQPFPTAITISDIDTAARICGREWVERIAAGRVRSDRLREYFPSSSRHPDVLRLSADYTDVDFGLLIDVAGWMRTRDTTGMPARQVPIPGVHGKWLDAHRPAVEALIGRQLALAPKHPARIHYTYLDPGHLASAGRRFDSASVGDVAKPTYDPSVVIIVENKDSAIHFPAVQGGIAVEGGGFGGATAASFEWISTAPSLFYWGDMDAEGFEILAGYRRDGLAVTSILMDVPTYRAYSRWGTDRRPNGELIRPRVPKNLPELDPHEDAAYRLVCQPPPGSPLRIEQERIPLGIAAAMLGRPGPE